MNEIQALTARSKLYAGLTPDDEALLLAESARIKPLLSAVTEQFYTALVTFPQAQPFLEGRLEHLRNTHLDWLERLFTGPYDETFTTFMYQVGATHVRVKLPVEFMACGITQISNHMLPLLADLYAGDTTRFAQMVRAVNSILGFSLIIMQESYQTSLLAEELERFLAITGISRTLFNNLASAYRT